MPVMTARIAVVLAVSSRATFQQGCDSGGVVRVLPGEGVSRHLHDINSVLQVKWDVELGGGRNQTWAPSYLTYRHPNTSEALSGGPLFITTPPARMLSKPPQAHKEPSQRNRSALAQDGPSPQNDNAWATSSNKQTYSWPSLLTIFVTCGRILLSCICFGLLLSYGFFRKTAEGRLAQEHSAPGASRIKKSSGNDHPPLCEEECCTRPPSMQWVDCQLFEESVTARRDLIHASLHRSMLAVGDAIMGAAALLRQEPEAGEDETVIPEMRKRLNEIPNWTSLPPSSKRTVRDALRSSSVLSSALQDVIPDKHTAVLEAALCLVFNDEAPAAPPATVEAST